MKKLILLTSLFSMFAFASMSQMIVYNGGFDSVQTTPDSDLEPVWWSVQAGSGGESTTDAFSGPYAVRIYNYSNTTKGVLLYGNDDAPNEPGMPILVNPLALNGYYKFDLGNNDDATDSARAFVWLTRVDQLNGGRDTVGSASMIFLPTSSYTAFTIPINYGADSLAADTLQIRFESSLNCNCTDTTGTCCFLYIDELSLELPNGLVELGNESKIDLTYDAASRAVMLNNVPVGPWHFRLIDVTGREIARYENVNGKSVNLDGIIADGVYLYQVVANGGSSSGKLVVR